MQAQVGVGMGFGVVGNLVQPGTGDHDAGGGDGMFVERVEAGGVFGVGDRKIVGVDDEQLRIGRIAQALSDGFGLGE